MEVVIERLGEQEFPIRTEKTGENRTFRYIYRRGDDGIKFDELGKKFPGVPRKKVFQWVKDLEASGKIVEIRLETGQPGRPATLYKAKEFIN